MHVPVMLEHVKENGYRATALVPTPLVAEAPTRDEAVDKIRTLINERFSNAELIQVQVPLLNRQNPWLAVAGSWREHPDVDEVVENIDAYRREVNSAPDRL